MERINVDQRLWSSSLHLAIMAGVEAEKNSGVVLASGQGYIELELKVEGVVVSFAKVAEDYAARLESHLERRAAELALSMLTTAGLDGIHKVLQEAEWNLKNRLRETFPEIEFNED